MSQEIEYLEDEVQRLEKVVAERTQRLHHARQTVELLEEVCHKAAKIAGHLPYLCQTLVEGSPELEQAALQLEQILVHRKV